MMNYRTLKINIDSESGRIVNDYGETISRDSSLPRIILADTVILECQFVTLEESSSSSSESGSTLTPTPLDSDFLAPRIISNIGYDSSNSIMFGANFDASYSDFENGIAAFLINTNTLYFQELLDGQSSKKAEFVIFSANADNADELIVLAKDYFVAENRMCESVILEDITIDNVFTKDEVVLLLSQKAALNHTHSEYAYSAGDNITIENGVISANISSSGGSSSNSDVDLSDYYTQTQVDNLLNSKSDTTHTHSIYALTSELISYSAGDNITIENGVISADVSSSVDLSSYYTQTQVDTLLNNLDIGDSFNGSATLNIRIPADMDNNVLYCYIELSEDSDFSDPIQIDSINDYQYMKIALNDDVFDIQNVGFQPYCYNGLLIVELAEALGVDSSATYYARARFYDGTAYGIWNCCCFTYSGFIENAIGYSLNSEVDKNATLRNVGQLELEYNSAETAQGISIDFEGAPVQYISNSSSSINFLAPKNCEATASTTREVELHIYSTCVISTINITYATADNFYIYWSENPTMPLEYMAAETHNVYVFKFVLQPKVVGAIADNLVRVSYQYRYFVIN